mmetsp:Transcript_62271/g.131639  ORF Transcript_62271/g.131639 Transcript_62271/m.131639 type:complete len:347 (-) Transcript_62271:37-1077(-)
MATGIGREDDDRFDDLPASISEFDREEGHNDPFAGGRSRQYDTFLDKTTSSTTSLSTYRGLSSSASRRTRFPTAEVAVVVILPWLVFFMVLSLFMFAYHEMERLVWLLSGLCAAMSTAFLCVGACGRHATFLAVGFLCLSSVGMAVGCGQWVTSTYLVRFWQLDAGPEFQDVSPVARSPDDTHSATLYFAEGTFVDDQRTLGFITRQGLVCVAPVSKIGAPDAKVQFWAVGEDCCEPRSNFDCGTSRQESLQKVAIVENVVDWPSEFQKAARMAASVHAVSQPSQEAQFVRFVSDPKAAISDLWNEALSVSLLAMVLDLLMCLLAGLVVGKALARVPLAHAASKLV